MPRKEGQKRKLLVLLQILARETDEKHPLSVPQLVEKLQEQGIEAERKSVYNDLIPSTRCLARRMRSCSCAGAAAGII